MLVSYSFSIATVPSIVCLVFNLDKRLIIYVSRRGFTGADLVAWSILGVVCGLVGAGFVAALDTLSRRRNYFTRKDLPDSTRKLRMFGEFRMHP